LIVHCQAAGFTVCNHQHATEKFPIADALPEVPRGDNGDGVNGSGARSSISKENLKKTFGDQLDWWQQVWAMALS
jgi:hypothetical protein